MVRMKKRKSAYRALLSKSEGKRALGRTRSRWEDNVKWILDKLGGGRGLH